MGALNIDVLLARLHWYAVRNARQRAIAVVVDALHGPAARPESMALSFPRLGWSATCTREHLEIAHTNGRRRLAWSELDPDLIDLDIEIVQRALYQDAESLLHVRLQPTGAWADFTAPGLFVIWVWNAALRAVAQLPADRGAPQDRADGDNH